MNEKQHILLVDDYKPLRLSLSEFLSEEYTVHTAENGIEAFDIIRSQDINLILLDIMLPFPLDGFAILRILKSDSKFSSIPVIIISALDQEEKILLGLEYGANDFVIKPFSEKQLRLKITNLLAVRDSIINNLEKDAILKGTNLKDGLYLIEDDFKNKFDQVIQELIEDNNCSNASIAARLSISISTLERKVKKVYGIVPKKYILNLKLEKAEIMLRQKMGNVNEVALAAGFNSVSYFCTCFKQKFKRTPNTVLNLK
jgi:DNA-binding response OmpR family regulator